MTISRFSSPLFIKDEIDHILLFETPRNERVRKALRDISSDLEEMQEMIRVISRWELGDYSDQTLISAWNLYCRNRGVVRLED